MTNADVPTIATRDVIPAPVINPYTGKEINGAKNWVIIGGLSFQPSEIVKLSLLLILSYYLSRRRILPWLLFILPAMKPSGLRIWTKKTVSILYSVLLPNMIGSIPVQGSMPIQITS